MTINSYGYQVMSLDEMIDALTQIRAMYPSLATQPVWVANCPPLHWPVKVIQVKNPDIFDSPDQHGKQLTEIIVERGGN